MTHPARVPAPRDDVEPLTADLRRLHVTVSRQFLGKLEAARTGPRAPIPAAVRRAVGERDGGRCAWPTDGGGRCGSTHRLELDHAVPWALGGDDTAGNLRVCCAAHNRLAARQAFGSRCVERYLREEASLT